MNSTERKMARRARREELRAIKKQETRGYCDDFDQVFTYENLYRAYQECRKGVSWKSSTQKFITNAPLEVQRIYDALHSGTWKSQGFYEFDILERGKKRHIKSVTMAERVVQRCLCDNALVPMLTPTFIYDNGATIKGKGYTFSINRCKHHLEQFYKESGQDGYVLTFDFSKYFDNINHALIKEIVHKHFTDPRLIRLIEYLIDCFGDIGLGLGSQISQIFALAAANRLDHYIKEVFQIKYYGRYMDDGYLIHHSKEYLLLCLKDIRILCKRLGIIINEKKTQIIKLRHGFTFLKCRFILLENGRVIKKLARKTITKARRRLKKYMSFISKGSMTCLELFQCFQSWRAYALNFNAYVTIKNMEQLYDDLFQERELCLNLF